MDSISIKTRTSQDGQYVATCPELSVSCHGQTEEEALSKLHSLICFQASSRDDLAESGPVLRRTPLQDDAETALKIVYTPDKIRVH